MGVVNIVGAGPVGLHCANLLAEEGFEATVFEEHSTVGRPVQCAGLVSKTGLQELGIELGNSVVNEVKGAKIFSPGGKCLAVERNETVAHVLDRFLFDQLLFKKSKRLGVEVKQNTKLIDVRKKDSGESSLFLQSNGHGELLKSQITVGCDGPNSVVRHSVFPGLLDKSFVHAIQIKAQGKFNKSLVEMHFGSFAPGFFAWVIPESGAVARIGLAVNLGENPAEYLQKFIGEKGLDLRKTSTSSALIPIAQPPKELASGPVLLAGDAAAHTKATTGGGIVFGLKAAEACAETIANHLKHRRSLADYSKNLEPVNKELSLHWKLYNHVHGMRPEKMDSLFAKAKRAGVEDFLSREGDMDHPSRFLRKMAFKPRMWGLLPAALALK